MTTNPTTSPIPLPAQVDRLPDNSCYLRCGEFGKRTMAFTVGCASEHAQQIADALNATKWVVRNADGTWPSVPLMNQIVPTLEWDGEWYKPSWDFWHPSLATERHEHGVWLIAAWSPIPALPDFKREEPKP